MEKIYIEIAECPAALRSAIEAAGYEVVTETPGTGAEREDGVLVSVEPGITATLRHELNNPLTAVMGFAQLLARRTDLPQDVTDKAGKILEHADRIRILIRGHD